MAQKIQMTTPIVEMDGDEMTRILWKMIKDELILPFVARLEAKLYVLGDSERNDTPVDTVGAVALCGILVADVGVAAKSHRP